MNRIWFLMIVGSICFLLWNDPSNTLTIMVDASTDALSLAIELCAVYAVWLGILEIVEQSGLSEKLAKLLRPLGVKVTRLAQGVAMGSDLEYADEVTLSRALEARREID